MAKSTTIDHSIITTDDTPVFQYSRNGESLTVTAGVTLQNQGPEVISGRSGFTGLTGRIDGTVLGFGAAIDAFGSSLALTIGATGRLVGGSHGSTAIEASGDSSIINHGAVENARGFGIFLTDVTDAAVENRGSIFGEVGGVIFSGRDNATSARLTNYGSIEAGHGTADQVGGAGANNATYLSAGTSTLVNHGSILATDLHGSAVRLASPLDGTSALVFNDGALASTHRWGVDAGVLHGAVHVVNAGEVRGGLGGIVGGTGGDLVENFGHIVGEVSLRNGDDTFLGRTGTVTGPIKGDGGNDLLVGGRNSDDLQGGPGDDRLEGNGGDDHLDGGEGSDTALYRNNTTPVTIDLPHDIARFPGKPWAPEALVSIENAETGSGNDRLLGDAGANVLNGGAGNDLLRGGGSADTLIGGSGDDIFRFGAASDSEPGRADTLVGGGGSVAFVSGSDVIDLAAIDADTTRAGNQAFAFGTDHGTGHLWVELSGVDFILRGNTDADAAAEFELVIHGGTVPTADDIIA